MKKVRKNDALSVRKHLIHQRRLSRALRTRHDDERIWHVPQPRLKLLLRLLPFLLDPRSSPASQRRRPRACQTQPAQRLLLQPTYDNPLIRVESPLDVRLDEPFPHGVENGGREASEESNDDRNGNTGVGGDPVLDVVGLLAIGVENAKNGVRGGRRAGFAGGRDWDLGGMQAVSSTCGTAGGGVDDAGGLGVGNEVVYFTERPEDFVEFSASTRSQYDPREYARRRKGKEAYSCGICEGEKGQDRFWEATVRERKREKDEEKERTAGPSYSTRISREGKRFMSSIQGRPLTKKAFDGRPRANQGFHPLFSSAAPYGESSVSTSRLGKIERTVRTASSSMIFAIFASISLNLDCFSASSVSPSTPTPSTAAHTFSGTLKLNRTKAPPSFARGSTDSTLTS